MFTQSAANGSWPYTLPRTRDCRKTNTRTRIRWTRRFAPCRLRVARSRVRFSRKNRGRPVSQGGTNHKSRICATEPGEAKVEESELETGVPGGPKPSVPIQAPQPPKSETNRLPALLRVRVAIELRLLAVAIEGALPTGGPQLLYAIIVVRVAALPHLHHPMSLQRPEADHASNPVIAWSKRRCNRDTPERQGDTVESSHPFCLFRVLETSSRPCRGPEHGRPGVPRGDLRDLGSTGSGQGRQFYDCSVFT